MRRQIRAFTLSTIVSERVDAVHAAVTDTSDLDRRHEILKALGLTQTVSDDVDRCGLRPADYDAIRKLTGVITARTGVEFINAAIVPLATRSAVRALIVSAQQANRRSTAPPTVNASRVVEALLVLGLDAVASSDSAQSTPPPSVKLPPLIDDERKIGRYYTRYPNLIASNSAAKTTVKKTNKKAPKNATSVVAAGSRRDARKVA